MHPYEAGRGDEVVKFPWKAGSVYSPPESWFHMHVNTGADAARHVALRLGSRKNPTLLHDATSGREGVVTSIREGGTLIEHEDEDPQIRKDFEAELKRTGVKNAMPPVTYRSDPIKAA